MQPWTTTKLAIGTVALAVLSLAACKKDEVRATLTPSNSPTLTASTTSVTLLQSAGKQTAATFTWTPVASLNLSEATSTTPSPAITYYLQFDTKGHNFGAPVSIAAGSASTGATTTTTVKVSDLNTALTQLGLKVGQATDVEVRLNASYASNSTTVSNVLPLNATTYECKQPAAANAWSIIGPAGKDWNTDIILTYDCSTNTFTYTGTLNAGEFKFRYGADWGTNLGGTSSTGGALTQGGPNLKIATTGTYTLELNPTITSPGNASGTFTIK